MKYLKTFESPKGYLFNIGDYVRFTDVYIRDRALTDYITEISKDKIYIVEKRMNENEHSSKEGNFYLIKLVYGKSNPNQNNASTEHQDDLELVQDYEISAHKFNI